nr:ODV-E56 [Menippe mercenaria nudivirus]
MASWLKSIRKGLGSVKDAADFDVRIDSVKNAKSGISNIDDTFKNLEFKQKGDEIYIHDTRMRDMDVDLRKGNIIKALDDANVPSSISASDEAAFRKTLSSEAPDVDIADLDAKIKSAKRFHSDLDVKSTSGADLESKLSNGSKEKAKSIWSRISKVVGVGAVAAGVFTAVLITDNVFDDIHKAAEARNGCYLVYKNTNTEACKITSKSCNGSGGSSDAAKPCTDVEILKYNIYCMVTHYVQASDTTNIDALKTAGCQWPDGATAQEVLDIEDNIPILVDHYNTKYPTFNSVPFVACELNSDYLGCISCDPTQPTNTLQYASVDDLEGGVTYKCNSNTTAIEAIVDIASAVGVDIFSASGDSISGSFQGNFFVVVIIILTLIALAALAFKLFSSKSKTPTNTNAPPPPSSSSSSYPPQSNVSESLRAQPPPQYEIR